MKTYSINVKDKNLIFAKPAAKYFKFFLISTFNIILLNMRLFNSFKKQISEMLNHAPILIVCLLFPRQKLTATKQYNVFGERSSVTPSVWTSPPTPHFTSRKFVETFTSRFRIFGHRRIWSTGCRNARRRHVLSSS